MATIEYDTKATGAEIRKALRAAFPGVKFSLRMSRGTGYGYFDLSWTDGPTARQVGELTDYFDSERFDGMTDSSYSVEPKLVFIEGHEMPVTIRYSCRGVLGQRSYSPEAKAWADEIARDDEDCYGTMSRRLLDRVDLTGEKPDVHEARRIIACARA